MYKHTILIINIVLFQHELRVFSYYVSKMDKMHILIFAVF